MPNTTPPDFLNATPADQIGICFSGGGYRAMLYHTGAIIRMNEMGLLPEVKVYSGVSGGSIAVAQLALAWKTLTFDDGGVATNLIEEFATPLVRFAHVYVDLPAVLKGLLPGLFNKHDGAAMKLANIYDKHLFHGASLQDLPAQPRFIFQAANLQTLQGFQFAREDAVDDRVGVIHRPTFRLARAVAASSAYPPFLSPLYLDMSHQTVDPIPGADLHSKPYTEMAVLTDGGVQDNMGLMPVLRACRTIWVSNAGAIVPQMGDITSRLVGQFSRTVTDLQEQSQQAHEIILNGLETIGQRNVAIWKIQQPVTQYGVDNPLALTAAETDEAAHIRTRLAPFTAREISLSMRAGYAGADSGLRARGFGNVAPAGDFSHLPRPDTGMVAGVQP